MSSSSEEIPIAGWNDQRQVEWYLNRINDLPPRSAGEDTLRSLLPPQPRSLLDLGCGGGRLADLVLAARTSLTEVVAMDVSPPMLTRARKRFAGDHRVTVRRWDIGSPIEGLGRFSGTDKVG